MINIKNITWILNQLFKNNLYKTNKKMKSDHQHDQSKLL